jgi:hypothetical protein
MATQDSRETTVPPFAIGSAVWPGGAKLAEEAGELVQVLGKLLAYPYDPHPDGSDLRERLIEELGDVQAAIAFFATVNGLRREVDARASKKLDRFHGWHADAIPADVRRALRSLDAGERR